MSLPCAQGWFCSTPLPMDSHTHSSWKRTPAAQGYLHGVHSDGQGRVIPVHLVLLARVLVTHRSLVCSSDPEHAQDDHEHQEADTNHDHHRGCAGNNCNQKTQPWQLLHSANNYSPPPARENGIVQVLRVYYYIIYIPKAVCL